jgi:hypothetical protein
MIKTFAKLFRRETKPVVSRPPPPMITWHQEQDGEIERRLKERWVQMFRVAPEIRRVFLVKATRPDESSPRVLLVIVSRGEPDAELAASIERMAAAELPVELKFAVLWLRPNEYAPIERVCTAFYYAA